MSECSGARCGAVGVFKAADPPAVLRGTGRFPGSYWRRWSQLKAIVLSLELEGQANVSIYRSKQDGQRISVARATGRPSLPSVTATFAGEPPGIS